MEIPPDSRTTKVAHDACVNNNKVAVYRKRKKQAKDMMGRGMPIKQIAVRLKTDIGTVQKWI